MRMKVQQDSQLFSVVSSSAFQAMPTRDLIEFFESMRTNDTPMSVPSTSYKLDSRNDRRITPQTVFNS